MPDAPPDGRATSDVERLYDRYAAGLFRYAVMVLADPSPVWCMAQDCADPAYIYAASNDVIAHGRAVFGRSDDGGRTWVEMTPQNAREEEIWAMAAAPNSCAKRLTSRVRASRAARVAGGTTPTVAWTVAISA